MWRGPAGYQGLRSIHKGQEVWEPCHWGSSYLISTKPVTCMSCCIAHMWGHDGWKKNLKIGWKKSKEHITDFLEIMRFFSILWVTSLSGNPPEIYSGQIHHMNTMRRGPMSASERAHHQRPLQEHQQLGPSSTWLCLRVSASVPLLAEYGLRLRGYRDRRGGNGIYIWGR